MEKLQNLNEKKSKQVAAKQNGCSPNKKNERKINERQIYTIYIYTKYIQKHCATTTVMRWTTFNLLFTYFWNTFELLTFGILNECLIAS